MDLGRIAELAKKYSLLLAGLAGAVFGAGAGGAVVYVQDSGGGCADYSVVSGSGEGTNIVEGEFPGGEECAEGGWVEVEGAVVSPGVHCLPYEAIVEEAIAAAGGLGEEACTQWIRRNINRASYVEMNSKIYVPFVTDEECGGVNPDTAGSLPPPGVVSESSGGHCSDGKVSINNATSSELESISGVGPSTAEKIIQGRPYASVADIMNVSGIGEKTYEKMKDELCL